MKTRFTIVVLLTALITACSIPGASGNPNAKLTPYFTPTILEYKKIESTSPTPLTAPTPTPTIHVVAAGETMSSIALRYGVETAAVMAVNPQVKNPNAMSVGIELTIPPPSGAGISSANSTPVPLNTEPLNCARSREGGVWCFLLVKNEQALPAENILAHIVIGNSQTGQLADQIVTAPLNILYTGKAMSLAVYFTPPVPDPFQTSFEVISALHVEDGNTRYLDAKIENLQVSIDKIGLFAKVYGEITLLDSAVSANQVWVAAFAYNVQGQVVGVRRWESASPLTAGQKLPFSFLVYSSGETIAAVDALVEARK